MNSGFFFENSANCVFLRSDFQVMTNTSRELLAQYCQGSEDAATAIFERYVERLTSLARIRMSERLARRIDPDDVVLSAYRSFFVAARDGRFTLENGGDLWRLLVSITIHKLHNQVSAHHAKKRSMKSESFDDLTDFISSHEPTPEDVLSACEELEAVLSLLSPLARQVVELRMQGESLEAIAHETSRTERTVRRMLELARAEFARRTDQSLERFQSQPARTEPASSANFNAVKQLPKSRNSQSLPQLALQDPQSLLPYENYVLQRFVGSGGSGKVFYARHKGCEQPVAIKFLKKAFSSHPEAVEQFVAEALITAKLRHPGIIGIHGIGRTRLGGYFLVLDWVPGGDLNVELSQAIVAINDAIRWVKQAAVAIHAIHEVGIIHCDLKPANLLLDKSRNVIVTDFGLALQKTRLANPSRGLAGTAAFMALEQVIPSVGTIGPQTDVYALGAILYALLTGRPPYSGKHAGDILGQLIAGKPIARPSESRTDVPKALESVCLHCLAREPRNRPASAIQLVNLLGEITPKTS